MPEKLGEGQFFGQTKRSIEITNARLTESYYAEGDELLAHSHALPHVGLIVEGAYEECFGHNRQTIPPGALTFYHPSETHSEKFLTNGIHFLIEVQPSDDFFAETIRPIFSLDRLSFGADRAIAWRLYREFKSPDCLSFIVMEALTLELLVESFRNQLTKSERSRPSWLNVVIDLLHSRFNESPSLSQLAFEAGVHPVHLAKTFRRFEGITIGEYMRRLRVRLAEHKLMKTDESLAGIAQDAGFSDQTHFTRVFRRQTGMTPAQFRKLFH